MKRFLGIILLLIAFPAFAAVYRFDGRTVTVQRITESNQDSLRITSVTGQNLTLSANNPSSFNSLLEWRPVDSITMILAAPAIDDFIKAHPETLVSFENLLIQRGLSVQYVRAAVSSLQRGYLSFRDQFFSSISFYRNPLLQSIQSGTFPPSFQRTTVTAPIETNVLLVTHSSRSFDPNRSTQSGLDSQISYFKSHRLPIVYLVHNDDMGDYTYFMSDRSAATYVLSSDGGEHSLTIDTNTVTSVGGYFPQCQFQTIKTAVESYFQRHQEPFNINLPMAAIYNGHDPFWETTAGGGQVRRMNYWNLAEAFQTLGRDGFLNLVRTAYLEAPEANNGISAYSESSYTIHVFINGIEETHFGYGPRILNLRFSE